MHAVTVSSAGFADGNPQIRDLPDPLHQMMQLRARQYRRKALTDLQALAIEAGKPVFNPSPDGLIRQDRER